MCAGLWSVPVTGWHSRHAKPGSLLPLVAVLAGLVLLIGSMIQLVPVLDQWRQASASGPTAGAVSSSPEGFEETGTAGDEYVVDEPAAAFREPVLTRKPTTATEKPAAVEETGKTHRATTSRPVPAPSSVAIPSIDVQSRLIKLGLNADRSLQVPRSYEVAGWYTKGPTPGELGPAVIVGHYDSVNGPAVFHRLNELRPGQSVQVRRADGSVAKFSVDRVKRFSKDDFPTDEVYGQVNRPELRLITCGGSFDYRTRHYRDNVVVFAHSD